MYKPCIKTFLLCCLYIFSSHCCFIFASSPKSVIYKGEFTKPLVPCCTPLHLLDGFYVGVGLGYDGYGFRQTLTATDDDLTPIALNPRLSAKGWVNGEIYGGYGLYFDKYYLAGEVLLNSSRADLSYALTSGAASYNTNVSFRESMGASLLPGIRLNRSTLGYARIGYMRTYMRVKEQGTAPLSTVSMVTTQWGNGLQFGMGLETAVWPYWQLRMEYTYITYRSFRTDLGTRFSPSNSQFLASVNYHFNY